MNAEVIEHILEGAKECGKTNVDIYMSDLHYVYVKLENIIPMTKASILVINNGTEIQYINKDDITRIVVS